MKVAEGRRLNIGQFPNFHRSGSIRGMKKLYYGEDCLLVRCGHLQRDLRTLNLQSGNNLNHKNMENYNGIAISKNDKEFVVAFVPGLMTMAIKRNHLFSLFLRMEK